MTHFHTKAEARQTSTVPGARSAAALSGCARRKTAATRTAFAQNVNIGTKFDKAFIN
jgi:hypothetical protein